MNEFKLLLKNKLSKFEYFFTPVNKIFNVIDKYYKDKISKLTEEIIDSYVEELNENNLKFTKLESIICESNIKIASLLEQNEYLINKLDDEIRNHEISLNMADSSKRMRIELEKEKPDIEKLEDEKYENIRINKIQCHIVRESLNLIN